MNSGLYAVPGDCATARAAATARPLAGPTTRLSKRKRGSSSVAPMVGGGRSLGGAGGRGARRRAAPGRRAPEAAEHQLRHRAERLEDSHAAQRIGAERRDAAEVE